MPSEKRDGMMGKEYSCFRTWGNTPWNGRERGSKRNKFVGTPEPTPLDRTVCDTQPSSIHWRRYVYPPHHEILESHVNYTTWGDAEEGKIRSYGAYHNSFEASLFTAPLSHRRNDKKTLPFGLLCFIPMDFLCRQIVLGWCCFQNVASLKVACQLSVLQLRCCSLDTI